MIEEKTETADPAARKPAEPEPFFSSARERRLWLWTAAAVAAIYATLGLATVLVNLLHNQTLSAVVFLTGMFLVGATVLTQGLRVRPAGLEIAVALGIAVVYLMFFLRLTIPERSHLIEYSVVAVFIYEALKERRRNGRRVVFPALLAVLATSLIGAFDEAIQIFLPARVYDPVDILFNSLAALMAVTASAALGWARRLALRGWNSFSRP